MADSCARVAAELAALKAEVARLKPVDENSIIKKAIAGAESLLKPEIAGVAVVAAGAVKQAGIAKNLADFATTEAFQATKTSRSAAVVADLAKKSAQGAVSISEIASMKAGSAFNQANRAAAEAAVAKALGTSAQGAAATATAKATIATRAAAVAQGVATGANALANSAIGKVLLLAANVLSLAGSIAGLFALYATLKIVFPRLDAHDRQLAQHDNELSKQMSLIVRQAGQIKQVEKTSNEALKIGEEAYGIAVFNDLQVRKLTDRVEVVNGKAGKAIKEAESATSKAKVAEGKAEEATTKAITAIGTANVAEGKAEQATSRANESFKKSEQAIGTAGQAVGVANIATVKATAAEIEAQKAIDAASTAIKEIATLKPRVDSVEKEATEAKSIGRLAYGTAVEIRPMAVDALAQVSQVRPISEQALTNAFNSLNKVNAVEPVANNAFTATQLQSKQLQGTQLEVKGLGNTTKLQDRKIVELGDRINNFKPPNTTTTTPEVDKEALEKLTQVVVSVGALKIAMDNMPKNLAKSPDLLNTIVQGTTTANCRTAAPSGCTGKAINNGINNALDNNNGKLGDLLKGLMQAGNTALDLDTNNRVKDLQKSSTALKQVTGADSYPIVLPEYLLDDHIDKPIVIENQVAYNVWLLKQIDALVGLFPIKIERTDENGQKQMLVYENIAEAIAEITGLLAEIAFDADTSVNVGVHATSEAIGAKIAAVQGNSYLKSIVDYLGFQGSHKSINVPISCTPGAVGTDDKLQENELGEFLKSSTQKAIGWECTERDDLHSIIKRILFDGEIARAALYKPIKPPKPNTPQTMTGDTIKADRKKEKAKEDKEWDLFKQRIKNQEGTGIDIDIDERPLDDGGADG